jgi:D-alanyl-D-alanine carboxypeptidase (penicillin-binding protein 5/6)
MNYGIDNYKEMQIKGNADLEPLYVRDGQIKYEPLHMDGNMTLLMREDETVQIEYDIPKTLKAPVRAGSAVGYAKYYINGTYFTEIPIYAAQDIRKIDFSFCFHKLFRYWRLQY